MIKADHYDSARDQREAVQAAMLKSNGHDLATKFNAMAQKQAVA